MLRDLGGLLYEMYIRDRFRKELLDYKCAEVARLEAEIRVLTVGPSLPPAQQPPATTEAPQPPAPAA